MRSMKKLMAVAALVLAVNLQGYTAERDPEAVKARFSEIFTRLDTGGDVLLVANIDGIFEETVDKIVAFASMAELDTEESAQFGAVLGKVSEFLRKNGFYAAQGVGLSIVPRSDGLNDVKMFLARDSEAMSLPLWVGMFGGEPRQLASQSFLPADTVLARVSSADIKEIWKLVSSGIREIASPEQVMTFDQSLAMASLMIGTGIEDLIGSLGDEGFISIQFSEDATINFPMMTGGGMDVVEMPSPSLLLCLAVKDNTLSALIESKLSGFAGPDSPIPLQKEEMGGVSVQTLNLPFPFPVPVEPTFAQKDGFFLLGTTRKAVTDALRASAAGKGLVSTDGFKKYFDNLPSENNGFMFVDKRFSEVMTDVQFSMLEAQAGTAGLDLDVLSSIMGDTFQESSAVTVVNSKSGIMFSGVSSSGGRELVSSSVMAPAGLLAAIAIPSFMRARTASQRNACIGNLRWIEAAKDQWALEHGKTNGTTVTEDDLKDYIRGGMPECQSGGVYSLGVIGENATCTEPGHRLP